MQLNNLWHSMVRVVLAAALLAGCGGGLAAISPAATGNLLLESGFKVEAVKSPDHLERLPGYQFIILEREGKTIYVYANLNAGNVYFGSEKNYYRYKALAAKAEAYEAPLAPPSERPTLSPADWDLYASLQGVDP